MNSFANYYKNRLWRNEVAVKKDMRRKELKVRPSPVQAVPTCSHSSFPQEQIRLEEAEKVESLLDMMEDENQLLRVEVVELVEEVDTDNTAPPSGASLISRSSTFPV